MGIDFRASSRGAVKQYKYKKQEEAKAAPRVRVLPDRPFQRQWRKVMHSSPPHEEARDSWLCCTQTRVSCGLNGPEINFADTAVDRVHRRHSLHH